MGYVNHLTITLEDKNLKATYKGSCLQTAKVIETNLSPGDALFPNTNYYFTIEDKNNQKFMDKALLEQFDKWRFGNEAFLEQDLKDFQYLIFEIGSKPYYVCFHLGVEDDYCLVAMFPFKEPMPTIMGGLNYVGDYYDQITFLKIC